MTAHKIFDGAFVMYSDMHLKECTSYFQSSTDSSLLYIDHCREGRIESEIGNHAYSYLQENEMRNDSNLLIVLYVQIMPDDLVMQLHRF